jgi:uncharacterized protein (DUF58 family)
VRLRHYFRRQTVVSREGWYYLAVVALVFGGAMLKEVNLLLILAGMLLGPLLLNWRAVRTTLGGLSLRRQLPGRIVAGEPLAVNLLLTNQRRRLPSWAVVVEERIERQSAANGNHVKHNHAPALRPSVLFPYVRPGQTCKGVYSGRLARRGRYQFGPLRVSTRFPFGLFSRTITIGQPESLIALPRLGRLTEGWAARRQESFAGVERRRQRPGPEGDFFGVRDWRPGDGKRLIHWRGSARRGELVVRQFERPRSRDAAVLLDLWRPGESTPEKQDFVELAVSLAATILTDLCRRGGSNVYLGLVGEDGPRCLSGAVSSAVLQGFLECLALAEPPATDALPDLLADALPRISPDAEIILVGTRPIDPAEIARLTHNGSDPQFRERLRRVRAVDVSDERLTDYFQLD